MAKRESKEEFQAQLDTLAAIEAKSTSAGTTSKWIAASDEKVKALVFAKIDGGRRLAGVTSFPSQRGEYAVVFAFERPESSVNLVQESVLVTVDLSAKKVVDIADPFIAEESPSMSVTGGTVPFAMRIPSNAPNVVVRSQAGAAHRAAERAFFARRGIERDPTFPGGGRPGQPSQPGWPLPDLPERGSWPGFPSFPVLPGFPSAAQTLARYTTPTATDLGTDTTTGEMTDDVENDGHTDYPSDWVPWD